LFQFDPPTAACFHVHRLDDSPCSVVLRSARLFGPKRLDRRLPLHDRCTARLAGRLPSLAGHPLVVANTKRPDNPALEGMAATAAGAVSISLIIRLE
jgi:hypothetical protein